MLPITEPSYELNDYQADKFIFYFNTFLDKANKGHIKWEDMQEFNQQILKYTGWDSKSRNAEAIGDITRNFFECLVDYTHEVDSPLCLKQEGTVTVKKWLSCWSRLLTNSKNVSDFPYWMQVLAKMWFLIIDCNGDGAIDAKELEKFYVDFVGLDKAGAGKMARDGIANMTAKGLYALDFDLFRYSFGAFFICRNHHGPGKYIFGYSDPKMENKPLVISRPSQDDDNKEFKVHIPDTPRVRINCLMSGSYMQ